MPCRDYRDDHPEIYQRELLSQINFLEAIACGAVTALEDVVASDYSEPFTEFLDFEEMGVSEDEFLEWWEEHKKADTIRRASELLDKLTDTEIAILKAYFNER